MAIANPGANRQIALVADTAVICLYSGVACRTVLF
jgi:hypothetical protein